MKSRAEGMDGQPPFPAWRVDFSQPLTDSAKFIRTFLEARSGDSWLLLTSTAVAGERQLWSAWLALHQRVRNDSMRSIGQDGEFLRLIAGTHHISMGFRRAGLADGDDGAWLVHLPPSDGVDELPDLDMSALKLQAQQLADDCEFALTDARPQPTAAGMVRLGIIDEDDRVLAELIGEADAGGSLVDGLHEDFFIGHIHTSDIHN